MNFSHALAVVAVAAFPATSIGQTPVYPNGSGDLIPLLQRAAETAMALSYSGVFVYRSGDREEVSRITHGHVDGQEVERIVVLDGSAREIMRNGREIKCYLPGENRVIVEQQSTARGFPGVMVSTLTDLQQNYTVRTSGLERVAGNVCQALILEPRDSLRYGHQLWFEPKSGLLLRSGLVSQAGHVLESYAFTQVSIGPGFARQQLIPSAEFQQGRVQRVNSSELQANDLRWTIQNLPSGFRIQKIMMRRNSATTNSQDIVHVVISDGLAAVSVFIEPAATAKVNNIDRQSGAVSIYSRQIGEFRALVMGEVPLVTARLIADAIERR